MGSCSYCLKAAFVNKKVAKQALPGITSFIKAMAQCYNTESESKSIWVQKYIKFIGGSKNLNYCRDLGQENKAFLDGDEIHYYAGNVGHLTEWTLFAKFVEKEFGATQVVWGSEEEGYSLETLQLYDYKGILTNILKNKSILPLLIGVHPDLDKLLGKHLKGD